MIRWIPYFLLHASHSLLINKLFGAGQFMAWRKGKTGCNFERIGSIERGFRGFVWSDNMSLHLRKEGGFSCLWLSILCTVNSSYLLSFPINSKRPELVFFFVHFHKFFTVFKFLDQFLCSFIHHRVTRFVLNRSMEFLRWSIHRVRSIDELSFEFSKLSHEPHIWLCIGSLWSDQL